MEIFSQLEEYLLSQIAMKAEEEGLCTEGMTIKSILAKSRYIETDLLKGLYQLKQKGGD